MRSLLIASALLLVAFCATTEARAINNLSMSGPVDNGVVNDPQLRCAALADEYCPSIFSFVFRTGELPVEFRDVPWAQVKDNPYYAELCAGEFQNCLDAIDQQFDTGNLSCPYTEISDSGSIVNKLYSLINVYYGQAYCGKSFRG